MPNRPKVLLLIPRLRGGGAARVSRNLAQGLSGRCYEVHLAAVVEDGADPCRLPDVRVHRLGHSRVRWGAPALIRLVRSLRPDAILSNMAHLNLLVLALRPAFPVGTRILVRNDGGMWPELLSPLQRMIYRRLHATADAIICQSERMQSDFAVELGRTDLLRVLPNPVDVEQARSGESGASRWQGPGPNLLAIGRLVAAKGFDLLLRAFAEIQAGFPQAQLTILGDGPEGVALAELASELGVAARVRFAGHVADPAVWFADASAFVLSSREDALSNALLEAAAAGLPIVATPARGGVPALLRDQPGTWTALQISAPDLALSLADALHNLEPGQRFAHAWVEPFTLPRAIDRYDELIRSVLANPPP